MRNNSLKSKLIFQCFLTQKARIRHLKKSNNKLTDNNHTVN